MNNISINHSLKQKLFISSKMKQALHILTLPSLELKTYIENELQKNPLLEIIEPMHPSEEKMEEKKDDTNDKHRLEEINFSEKNL